MSTLQEAIAFLEEHVNGKTLYTHELTYALEDGALEGVYADQMSFCGLKYWQTGLQLDMFIVSNEKIYEMDGGMRASLRKDFSAVSLFRYELAQRRSTGGITGFFRFISASGKAVPAEAIVSAIFDVRMDGGALCLEEDQALYRDQPVRDGQYKPVAFRATHRFFVEDGKLHYEYNGQSFDVDTQTMARRASGDSFPPFVSVER